MKAKGAMKDDALAAQAMVQAKKPLMPKMLPMEETIAPDGGNHEDGSGGC